MKQLIGKNNKSVKLILLVFFTFAFLIDLAHRYYYRAPLIYRFSWYQYELMVLICLLVLNPRGIKIIVSTILILLIILSTKSAFFENLSGHSPILIFRYLFNKTNLDSSLVFLIHIVLYLSLLYLIFKRNLTANSELIDQKIEQ
jgi:hypothetical protein